MFFPIIGCFLTLLSPIQSVSPQQQLQQSSNQFFGAYNFREVNYYDYLLQYYPTTTPEDYEFDKNAEGVYDLIAIYHSANFTYQVYPEFKIVWDGYSSSWVFSYTLFGNPVYTLSLGYSLEFSTQSTAVKNFTIYFPQYTYLEQEYADIFNFFFTQQSNSYHSYYTGYYTFNNTPSGSFELYGNVSANNSLFNNISYGSSGIIFRHSGYIGVSSYHLYQNSTWNSSRSIYFSSVLLPDNLKAYMDVRGVFAYIPQTELSDLQDLFFALADTPIYYLTTWFNFELLGFNFGIAIISLLSLLLVLFIVKKLTK